MQNANIRYVIRIDRGEHINREVTLNIYLTDFEGELDIAYFLKQVYDIDCDTWGSEYYTVLERNIEVFND